MANETTRIDQSIVCAVNRRRRDVGYKRQSDYSAGIQAVKRLRELGLVFYHHQRPSAARNAHARDTARLRLPMAAFSGGVIVLPDLSVVDQRTLPDYVLPSSSK